MVTKKQYSKPQVIELGDAVKATLRYFPGIREFFLRRRRFFGS